MNLRQHVRYIRKALEAWGVVAKTFGWKISYESGRPLDGSGNPIPWFTYPAVEFLKTLDLSNARVFEYGSGNSSFFFAQRAKEVIAVENDLIWADIVASKNIENLKILKISEKESYVNSPLEQEGKFDIVVVDGRNRIACTAIAADVVFENGIVIIDNSDWYPLACSFMRERGWFQVDFSGLGPIAPFPWTTSVFFRCSVPFKRNENYVLEGAADARW